MNQIPTERTPRPKAKPIVLPKRCAPPEALVITTAVTALLLVISLMILSVALIVGPTDPPENDRDHDRDNEQMQTNDKPNNSTNDKPNGSGIVTKTDIQLPCATKGVSSYSFDNVKTISSADGIESQAAALIDVTNGKAVAGKNGSEKIYPASMTKVMTLLVACEKATDPTALLTITEAMAQKYRSCSTSGGKGPSVATSWTVGDQITVEDALHLVIYESDTYACWLLAEHIASSESAFVAMMNDRAKKLGISDTTHFENCTGLYHDDHYTTCFDMATIMAAAMKNEAAKKVLTSSAQYTVDVYANGAKSESFSMWSGWYTGRLEKYRYGKAAARYAGNGSDICLIAGKTGYETIPKYCFVTAGENDVTGTLFVCVQVGAESPKASTDDSREIYQKFAKY